MKIKTALFAITLVVASCKKDEKFSSGIVTNTYSSIQDFYSTNGVQTQTYTINATAGGMFVSPKGTKVTIPANAFITQSGGAVTGLVTIEFKDIYSKSDMLLSNVPSMTYYGSPLKSAGEFFIKASVGTSAVVLDAGKSITIEQPAMDGFPDTAMAPFAGLPDTTGWGGIGWWPNPNDSINFTASNYIYTMYNFNYPADSGTWSNSDNSSFFSAYTQTTLAILANDPIAVYNTQVFLVFTSVNSMVHSYITSATNFDYSYAPVGLQCTVVALGVKDGKLYSSFTPITITAAQTINFSLTETTDIAFKAQLNALN